VLTHDSPLDVEVLGWYTPPATLSPSGTMTPSQTPTGSMTPSHTPTMTMTSSMTPSMTPTSSGTRSVSRSPAATASPTATVGAPGSAYVGITMSGGTYTDATNTTVWHALTSGLTGTPGGSGGTFTLAGITEQQTGWSFVAPHHYTRRLQAPTPAPTPSPGPALPPGVVPRWRFLLQAQLASPAALQAFLTALAAASVDATAPGSPLRAVVELWAATTGQPLASVSLAVDGLLPSPAPDVGGTQSDNNSRNLAIGLGVGLGVGIPVVVLLLVAAFFATRRSAAAAAAGDKAGDSDMAARHSAAAGDIAAV
jgi:hypothetical protein